MGVPYLPLFFVGIGVFVACVGLRTIWTGHRLQAQGARVPGVVARLRYSQGRNSIPGTYYPVLQFRTDDGRDIETESDVSTNLGPFGRLREGTQVTVVYDRQKPTVARVDTPGGRGMVTGLISVAGGIAFVVVSLRIMN